MNTIKWTAHVEAFVNDVTRWAEKQTNLLALVLVGSQARGNARRDSDIDLVIVCNDPKLYLDDFAWIEEFGTPSRTAIEDWGLVTSVRVWYVDGLEIEFGFTSSDWIKEPLDAGTKQAIGDGYRILADKSGMVAELFAVGQNA